LRAISQDAEERFPTKEESDIKGISLQGKTREVRIPCEKRYARPEDVKPMLTSASYWERDYAKEGLRRFEAGESFDDHATYQVQTLWLNRETALIGLDAEPLCGLGKRIEVAVAPSRGITLGYVNDCVSYLPDTHELKRGGYEVDSFLFSNWSGPWLPGLEDVVVDGVTQLQA